jgi:O-antigen/teichoic acid export membrane protein
MSARRALARDVVASLARHVATAGVGLVTIPILARVLGARMLGFWSLLGTSAFLLALCDLGLNAATLRVAAGEDAALAKRTARYASRWTLALATPASVVCGAWLWGVARELPGTEQNHARIAVAIALAAGILNAAAQSGRSYAHGRGRITGLARARALGAVVQLIVTVALLAVFRDLLAVAIGYAAGTVLESRLSWTVAKDDVYAPGVPSAAERQELRVTSRAAFLTNLSVVAAVRIDVLILQQVTNLETIAAYSVASRLVDQAYTFVKQISAALVPRLGGRARNAEGILSAGTMVIGALAAAPLAVLAVAGRPLVVLWAGPAVDRPILGTAAAWLAVAGIVAACEEIASSRIALGGDPRVAARAFIFGSLVNVSLSVVGAYTIGPSAVAAATLAGNLVAFVLLWRATRMALGWSLARVASALSPALVAGCIGALIAVALRSTPIPLVGSAAIAVTVACLVSYASMHKALRRATEELG